MDKDVLDAERVNNCCYAISGKDGVWIFPIKVDTVKSKLLIL
jgi:hypothetical protein